MKDQKVLFFSKDPAPVTQKDDIQMKFFQKFVKCSFFCAESKFAIRFPEFGFNHPLGVTKGQNKKFQKKQQIWHIYFLNIVENDSECQKPKKSDFDPIRVLYV